MRCAYCVRGVVLPRENDGRSIKERTKKGESKNYQQSLDETKGRWRIARVVSRCQHRHRKYLRRGKQLGRSCASTYESVVTRWAGEFLLLGVRRGREYKDRDRAVFKRVHSKSVVGKSRSVRCSKKRARRDPNVGNRHSRSAYVRASGESDCGAERCFGQLTQCNGRGSESTRIKDRRDFVSARF
jgi:hypothetical protein